MRTKAIPLLLLFHSQASDPTVNLDKAIRKENLKLVLVTQCVRVIARENHELHFGL